MVGPYGLKDQGFGAMLRLDNGRYFVHQTLFKRALKNCFRHVLYFDTTLNKTGIGTLLVDEDDIKKASESLMHFDTFLVS